MNKQISSDWDPETQILTTRLTGNVTVEDVARWEASLQEALAAIEDGGSFKLLHNLTGYELQDMAAHKAMRLIIPRLLADHGMRPAVAGLFPEIEVTVQKKRGITCRAYANVHHDVDKMGEYERTLSNAQQRFFTDPQLARTWLLSVE